MALPGSSIRRRQSLTQAITGSVYPGDASLFQDGTTFYLYTGDVTSAGAGFSDLHTHDGSLMKKLGLIFSVPVVAAWDHGGPSGQTAQRVQPLVTSIGVNTHIYQGGVYCTSNIISDLAYLGVNSVRDYPRTYFSQTTNYNTLAAAGVKFDFDVAAGNCNSDSVASTLASDWASFISSYPGTLLTVEGLNEINNQPSCYLQAATTNATTANGNPTLHFAATLASLQAVHSGGFDAGMTIVDTTTGSAIPSNTVQSSAAATTVTMNQNAAGGWRRQRRHHYIRG